MKFKLYPWSYIGVSFKGPSGSSAVLALTSAGLHNFKHINNCENRMKQLRMWLMIRFKNNCRSVAASCTDIQMTVFVMLFCAVSCISGTLNEHFLFCLCLCVWSFTLMKARVKITSMLPGPDTGGSGLWDFFGSSLSFSSCFRVLRWRASLNMGKAWAGDTQGKQG